MTEAATKPGGGDPNPSGRRSNPAADRESGPAGGRGARRALHVVGAAIVADGRCLATLRGDHMTLPGRWELPGGKVLRGEDPRRALAREIDEELGLVVRVGALLGESRVPGDPQPIWLQVYLAEVTGGSLELREHAASRWLTAAELDELDWAEADRPLLPRLRSALSTFSSA